MAKSIIITGATGNLGGAVTKRLVADGYKLYVTLVPNEKAPDDRQISGKQIDLLNESDCKNYVDEVVATGNELQAGVLLVGGFQMGGLAETGLDAFDKMFSMNFYTAFTMAKALMVHFAQKGGGQIILIGARPGLEPKDGKNAVAYALSKSLVFRLAEIINQTGKEKNIHATVIVPSTIDTAINRQSMPGADFQKWVPAASIADTIAFLLGDSGSMVRESVIKVYNNA
jgi:NAD(P)-dependent dehydrogenase (short-subunit alcohol dehydrogenase family)